jgi:hypothetical protein
MSERKQAYTAHGEVEYETVECDSCGEDVVKEEAMRFGIAQSVRENYRADEEKLTGVEKVGWVCPWCQEDPIKYPAPTDYDAFTFYIVSGCLLAIGFLIGVIVPL